ncbi:MAG: carbonic anhydrase family protein [Flavobacteriaceae bacterium]
MNALTKETQSNITPTTALDMLKEGNQRFLNKSIKTRDLNLQVEQTSTGQFPFACVLGCIDSRVPSELVFDQGIGDIFNVRIAGNFVNTDILGSMEFACKVAGSKIILVLGHTKCGAIKGACDHVKLGNLTAMLQNFDDVLDASEYAGDRSSQNSEFVDLVTHKNIEMTIDKIRKNSPVLSEMEKNGEILIAGAIYDVTDGSVNFL